MFSIGKRRNGICLDGNYRFKFTTITLQGHGCKEPNSSPFELLSTDMPKINLVSGYEFRSLFGPESGKLVHKLGWGGKRTKGRPRNQLETFIGCSAYFFEMNGREKSLNLRLFGGKIFKNHIQNFEAFAYENVC